MSYYALYIPGKFDSDEAAGEESNQISAPEITTKNSDRGEGDNAKEFIHVYQNKAEALAMLRTHKDARMREFGDITEALNYTVTGFEVIQSKYNDVKTSTAAVEKPTFCAPTKQKLVAFRKYIELGNYALVKSLIWENPRYLVNSGDTPTSLKDGCRYNAMHVCAINNRKEIAELILATVSDPAFINLLTGSKNDMKMCGVLAANLLDYYLNIPEKGRLETPLHLAAKYGHVGMVKLLTSYPSCKMIRNKENKFPNEIIGSRGTDSSGADMIKICDLLEKRFYVPVIRSVGNDVPPQVGPPFSVEKPPNLKTDPLSPEMKIHALAGPMNEQEAKNFCRRWKTPPRMGSNSMALASSSFFFSTPIKSRTPVRLAQEDLSFDSLHGQASFGRNTPVPHGKQLFDEKRQNGAAPNMQGSQTSIDTADNDVQNGNNSNHAAEAQTCPECVINNNTQPEEPNASLHFSASLPSLQICPPSPSVKLQFAENRNVSSVYDRNFIDSPGFKERSIKNADSEKGLEVIGRELAKAQKVDWCEYWDFLSEFVDIATADGLKKLESYFEERVLAEELKTKISLIADSSKAVADDVGGAKSQQAPCTANPFDKIGVYKDAAVDTGDGEANNACAPQSTTPYTYVEKSVQVFAKRMTKTILFNIENAASINYAFVSELKRLKSLICSFKDDPRFVDVNFAKVHARFAFLIANYLADSQDVDDVSKSKIQRCLSDILMSPSKTQLHCVCRKVKAFLDNPIEQIAPENLKTETMCAKAWLAEDACECLWEPNLTRKTSRRNRIETRFKTLQQDVKDAATAAAPDKQRAQDEEDKKAKTSGSHEGSINFTSHGESLDDDEEDVFWSDCAAESNSDDDVWMTPPENNSEMDLSDEAEDDKYNVFIFGNEPTKRDLDVLNAIFNVDITKTNYPYIYNWKISMLNYINEGIDSFPSPSVGKRTHSSRNAFNDGTPNSPEPPQRGTRMPSISNRLFSSPMHKRPPQTPLNKMRGLFTAYREYLENSPMSPLLLDTSSDSAQPSRGADLSF